MLEVAEKSCPGIAFRIEFGKKGKRARQGYSVDAASGEMNGVSLIQLGEAIGHGIYVDELSLASALEVLSEKNLPAFITHNGALVEDRMLKQVGFFSGFFVQDGKLKAEQFQALESFKEDESERYNRLFDLATQMPDAFGLSLVFEAELVWVFSDGTEKSISDSDGKGATREVPSVRFISIGSADFVDAPAANEDGLFSKNKTEEPKVMEKPDTKKVELEEEPTELAEDDVEREEDAEEQDEEVPEEEIDKEDDELAALRNELAELRSQVEELNAKLSDSETENEKLSKALGGDELTLLSVQAEHGGQEQKENLVDKFLSSEGTESTRLWKQNKEQLMDQLGRR